MYSFRNEFTEYGGRCFRSKTEAMYAAVFGALGAVVEYEPRTFSTPVGGYVPDFYVPATNSFIEIKGSGSQVGKKEAAKAQYVATVHDGPMFIFSGKPDVKMFRGGMDLCNFAVYLVKPDTWRGQLRGSRLFLLMTITGTGDRCGRAPAGLLPAQILSRLQLIGGATTCRATMEQLSQEATGWRRMGDRVWPTEP